MKARSRTILFVCAALILLALFALFLLQPAAWTVIVNGEHITGLPGAGYAFGGVFAGLSIALLVLVLVCLIMTGVSLFVFVILAVVFFALLVFLSPLLIPVLLITGLIMLINRKKAV